MTVKREEREGGGAMETSSSSPPSPTSTITLGQRWPAGNDCELVTLVRPNKMPALQAN